MYRKCVSCKEFTILNKEPKWKDRCKKCYITLLNKILCLECRKIKPKFKEDIKVCKECWFSNKERVKSNCLIDVSSL